MGSVFMRIPAVLAVALFGCLPVLAQVPARPDFSGEWVLDAARSKTTGMPVRVGGPPGAAAARGTVSEPRKIKHVRPEYPVDAQRDRITGIVVLEAIIDPRGKVVDVRVLRSVPLLDRAAMDAVSQWEYTPTFVGGVAVPVVMTVTLTFSLDGARPQMGAGTGPIAQPPGGRPGRGQGFVASAIQIKQDDRTLTITRNSGQLSESVVYRFDGGESRNQLPGSGGAIDNVYRFVSRWEGDKLVTRITWRGPMGLRERVETMSLDGDTLTIESTRPAFTAGGEPMVQTNVFTRKR